jgi:glycosyltransferase involved in cell wall biosynthesis
MKYVSVSYNYSPDFSSPESWLRRTKGSAGILECISKENEVINIKQINYEGNCFHNGVDYHFVDFGKRKTYFPLRLNRYIKNLNADIVIVQGLHHPLQLIQLGLLLSKKTKIIVHHHAEKPFNGYKKYIQKMADLFADAYLFASDDMGLDWVTKGIIRSSKKIHEVMEVSSVFYPGNKEAARLKTGIDGNPIFLWVGRLNDNKDPLTVIKAFLKYTTSTPGARLYMVYHTSELFDGIKQLLKNNAAGNRVIMVGQLEHNELLYWFNSADFFISGSHYEGSGTALCEAMACGCVPIVTDIPSFRMITGNGDCGLLYEAGNEDALLAALMQTKIIDLPAKQKKALARFRSKLSFEAIAENIQTIATSLKPKKKRLWGWNLRL